MIEIKIRTKICKLYNKYHSIDKIEKYIKLKLLEFLEQEREDKFKEVYSNLLLLPTGLSTELHYIHLNANEFTYDVILNKYCTIDSNGKVRRISLEGMNILWGLNHAFKRYPFYLYVLYLTQKGDEIVI